MRTKDDMAIAESRLNYITATIILTIKQYNIDKRVTFKMHGKSQEISFL